MASEISNYQCPACTGPLHFSETNGKLVCDYCDSEYTVEEIEAMFREQDAAAAAAHDDDQAAQRAEENFTSSSEWGSESQNMRAYGCPSCGAELICDATTAATCCPYCGNPTVVPGKFSGGLKPEFIIPFKIGKQQALDQLKKHYEGKKLLPDFFKEQNHIEKIQGVYVPYWLYDSDVKGDIWYDATIAVSRDTSTEYITDTSYYKLHRRGQISLANVPADASKKMDDNLMDSLEPFNYKDMVPFSTAYLPGFLADRYDVSQEECKPKVMNRIENSALSSFKSTVGHAYTTASVNGKNLEFEKVKAHYALMPVWLLNTRCNGKLYTFAMNGQTGRFIGDLPMDKGKYWKYRAKYTGIVTVIAWIVFLAIYYFT